MPARNDGRDELNARFRATVTRLASAYQLPNLYRGPKQIAWLTWRVWHHLGTAQGAKKAMRRRRQNLARRVARARAISA